MKIKVFVQVDEIVDLIAEHLRNQGFKVVGDMIVKTNDQIPDQRRARVEGLEVEVERT